MLITNTSENFVFHLSCLGHGGVRPAAAP